MTTDADQFLMGGGGRSASFKAHGDEVWGVVMDCQMRQQTNYESGKLEFWDDGKPRMQLVVTLLTEQHDGEDDDGLRRVYIKGQMQKAVADAVRKVGAQGVREGGRLFVRYIGDAAPARRGVSGAKQYFAKYEAPAQEVSLADIESPDPDDIPF